RACAYDGFWSRSGVMDTSTGKALRADLNAVSRLQYYEAVGNLFLGPVMRALSQTPCIRRVAILSGLIHPCPTISALPLIGFLLQRVGASERADTRSCQIVMRFCRRRLTREFETQVTGRHGFLTNNQGIVA